MLKTGDSKASLILIATLIISFTLQVSVFFEVESPLQCYEKETKATSSTSGFQFPNSYHKYVI